MNILLINGCWTPNIGNAFVNIGIEGIVNWVYDKPNIYYSSNINNRWFLSRIYPTNSFTDNSFDLTSTFSNIDLIVWGGMMLTLEFVSIVGNSFDYILNKNIPILFAGAGGVNYDSTEMSSVMSFFDKFSNYYIITRDSKTFDMYKNTKLRKKMSQGIDSAFFLPEAYTPPTMIIPEFDVECFDRIPTPEINHYGRKIIYTHHDVENPINPDYVKKPDTIVSELPYDYLTLYKNVNTTYAERIHACIATLAYGNRAQIFTKSQRISLFDKLLTSGSGSKQISKEPISLDKDYLDKIKRDEIQLIKSIF